ncbi:hypothetical protein H5125_21340 [Shewanella sp. SR44-4]|jgi:hypothetical protein|uniref:hypothetical protein n=1 Tax=unclassified Shewanella TaxID=196818 RepID=UPI0015FF5415|nr:hypothetical protein [Shewanella sp. SR44-4]MBB1364689.1 hypothetical protein [Shewanella sp. SR44-4]
MTSAVIEHIEPEEKQGFLSKLFNKITAPVRDWLNDITDLYEDAKIRVETGVTPNREFSSAELDEQRFKHIVKNVYMRDVVESSPEGLRASIEQFHKDNGGGFDVEEVARYAETIP